MESESLSNIHNENVRSKFRMKSCGPAKTVQSYLQSNWWSQGLNKMWRYIQEIQVPCYHSPILYLITIGIIIYWIHIASRHRNFIIALTSDGAKIEFAINITSGLQESHILDCPNMTTRHPNEESWFHTATHRVQA